MSDPLPPYVERQQYSVTPDRSRLCPIVHPDADDEEFKDWKCAWCGLGPGLRGVLPEPEMSEEAKRMGLKPLPFDHPARRRERWSASTDGAQ